MPQTCREIGDIDVSSIDQPFAIGVFVGMKTDKVGSVRFSPKAAKWNGTRSLRNLATDVPKTVVDQFVRQLGPSTIGGYKTDDDGFLMVGDSSDYRNTFYFTSLFAGWNLTGMTEIQRFIRDFVENMRWMPAKPAVKIPERALENLAFDTLKMFFTSQGEFDRVYAGKLISVSEDGRERVVSDSDLASMLKSSKPDVSSDGYATVRTSVHAKYAADHHDDIGKIDITGFEGGSDTAFRDWITEYLGDTEYEEEYDPPYARHVHKTRLPKIRMTREQWRHRNDGGPVFAKSPNLKDMYGEKCDGDEYYDGSAHLEAMPDFVVFADEEPLNEYCGIVRRLGL